MLIGLINGLIFFFVADSAHQQTLSLVPIIGAYVLGRALENFVDIDQEIVFLLRRLISDKPSEKSTKSSKGIDSDINKKDIGHSDDVQKFINKLNDDEMLIRMKTNREFGSLKIIKKSKHETDKELHLTKDYKVIYAN